MTRDEAEGYVKNCGEDEGPETWEETAELFEAIFNRPLPADMSKFEAWSHVCAAVQVG